MRRAMRTTTQLDGIDAMLLLLALMLVLFAPMMPTWWSFGLAGGGLVAYLASSIYARHHRHA